MNRTESDIIKAGYRTASIQLVVSNLALAAGVGLARETGPEWDELADAIRFAYQLAIRVQDAADEEFEQLVLKVADS